MTALLSRPAELSAAPLRTAAHVKRVCLITEAAGAGVGRHFLDLAAGLAQRDVEVLAIYSPRRCDTSFTQRKNHVRGVHFVELPLRRAIHPLDALDLVKLTRLIHRHGPFDILHCHSSKAGALGRVAAACLGIPSVYTPHALVTLDPTLSPLKRRFYAGVERWLDRRGQALIAVSPDEAEHAAMLGIARHKIHTITNGIDPPDFPSRQAARHQLNLQPNQFCIGFVGRLTAQKSPELLIAALAELRQKNIEAVAAIVGSGPLQLPLRDQIEQLGLAPHVRLLGDCVAISLMPAFDVFCLPSRYEGLPYVLLEALAAGLPIVATRVGGVAACVDPGHNGFILDSHSPTDFAEALSLLATNPVLRQACAAHSLAKSTAFSARRMIDDTLALYAATALRPGSSLVTH